MLREVGKIYARSFRIIFQHPQFLLLSVGFILFSRLNSYVTSQLRALNELGLQCAILEISLFQLLFSFAIFFGVPLAFILMTCHLETGINLKEIWFETLKYFWAYFRQYFAGIFLSLAYSLPVSCLILFSVFVDDALFMMIIIPIWLLVFGYLNFGSIALGQRILLNGGEGVFKNSMQGLRVLNGNFVFFLTLYVTHTIITTTNFLAPYLIGSAITGVDLLSVPITPFSLFMQNAYAAVQTPYVTAMSIVLGIFLFPVSVIVPTLAYLHVKNGNVSAYTRR